MSASKLKIAIVVHGRWDAFDLARELDARGVEVALFTNYPAWAVTPFGVPHRCVHSFWLHGVLSRALARVARSDSRWRMEALLHPLFGRWAAQALLTAHWDIAYVFSGVAEECFRALAGRNTLRVLVRESSHIRTQDRLLAEEEQRTGWTEERPTRWMIAREEREYALADVIRVLSTFTYESFLAHGTSPARVKLIVSGAPVARFRPAADVIEARRRRIVAGEPLRVLNVGAFTLRKGVWDTAAIVRELGTRRFRFRFVGPVARGASKLALELQQLGVEFVGKQPEASLPRVYAWGDLFLQPTIEDGFQAVLAQAVASGVPVLTTPNGAGHDLVREDRSGWVLPARNPDAFAQRLRWIDVHRAELARMVSETYARFQPRDIADVAAELETVCRTVLELRTREPVVI